MTYEFNNKMGTFFLTKCGGQYLVSGSIKAASDAFRKIGKRPPNKYGTFFGRERAGAEACQMLIEQMEGG